MTEEEKSTLAWIEENLSRIRRVMVRDGRSPGRMNELKRWVWLKARLTEGGGGP